ncbi:unnamed protein product, partial [Amoebophrya sp. A25]
LEKYHLIFTKTYHYAKNKNGKRILKSCPHRCTRGVQMGYREKFGAAPHHGSDARSDTKEAWHDREVTSPSGRRSDPSFRDGGPGTSGNANPEHSMSLIRRSVNFDDSVRVVPAGGCDREDGSIENRGQQGSISPPPSGGHFAFLQERVFALSHSRWSPSRNSPDLPHFASYYSLFTYLHRAAGIYSSVLRYMIITTVVSIGIYRWDQEWDAGFIQEHFPLAKQTSLVSIFTGVLSFTLVFRINLAYGRWWDSRRSSETFAVKLMNVALESSCFDQFTLTSAAEHYRFRARVCGLASLAHAEAVKELGSMRDIDHLGSVLLAEGDFKQEVDTPPTCRCGVMQTYAWLTMLITGRFNQHMVPSPILARLHALLDESMEAYFDALLIRTTPFPRPFTQIINMGLFLSLILIPLITASSCGSSSVGCVDLYLL